jgi:hypothetical protein
MNGEQADNTTFLVLRRLEEGSSPTLTDNRSSSSLKVIGCAASMMAVNIILPSRLVGTSKSEWEDLLSKFLNLFTPFQQSLQAPEPTSA